MAYVRAYITIYPPNGPKKQGAAMGGQIVDLAVHASELCMTVGMQLSRLLIVTI